MSAILALLASAVVIAVVASAVTGLNGPTYPHDIAYMDLRQIASATFKILADYPQATPEDVEEALQSGEYNVGDLVDPWDNPFRIEIYESESGRHNNFAITSPGKNKKYGDADDLDSSNEEWLSHYYRKTEFRNSLVASANIIWLAPVLYLAIWAVVRGFKVDREKTET